MTETTDEDEDMVIEMESEIEIRETEIMSGIEENMIHASEQR